ncbi:MAG: class I adenylate-forming enzyme family protein [Zoogloea sp.]|uniref:class I adenylate-forming enzyme family protein n=1 Tax=Zoogloea sp. TaxID=49181 RepID=UPI002603D444|nr:class I adenylate-forming enzyme family protein [Zoogloea sp.]MDD2991213.1 class I adenylate-forming enzyme family protein [Zoogloea sp.]
MTEATSQGIALALQARAQLTAPGAPFEVIECTDGDHAERRYRNAFPTLPALLAASRAHGDKPYIQYQGETWTFTRFFAEADAVASWLHKAGVCPGDRVAIAMRNRPEWGVAFVATALLGAIPAPLNSFGLREELHAALADLAPKVLFCDPERHARVAGDGAPDCVMVVTDSAPAGSESYAALAAQPAEPPPVADVGPDDPALILFTSGATSRAKGVLSTQRAVCQALFNIDFIGAVSGMSSPEAVAKIMARGLPPTTLTAVPLFHVSGLHAQLLNALRNGRRLVFTHRWDPATALDLIAEEKVTQFNGAPSMVLQLLAEPRFDDPAVTGNLGGLGFGGAGLPQRAIDEVLKRPQGDMSGIGFGLTESNGVGAAASGAVFRHAPRSSGLISPIIDLCIMDAEGNALPVGSMGEICLRGVTLMQGYWNDPDATAGAIRGGWFHTGDVGYVSDEGLLFVVDRIKDVINRSGEKIAAAEVESCLLQHPDLEEAAVFAMPDEGTGEAVAAAVVVREGRRLSEAELQAHVAAHLAGYKVPARIFIRQDALPRNPAGKLLKGDLKRACLSPTR